MITQHDHGLISGQLATAWGNDRFELPVPCFEALLAISLHDLPWMEQDADPPFNPATGRPYDFMQVPLEEKLPIYSRGLDVVERIHPYAGLLGSLHYTSFTGTADVAAFQDAELSRQSRISKELELTHHDQQLLATNLDLLRFLDNLSLVLCLTPPDALAENCPPWINQDTFRFPPAPWTQGAGTPIRMHVVWADPTTVCISPFPLCSPIQVQVPYRTIAADPYPYAAAYRADLHAAETLRWMVTVQAGTADIVGDSSE